jgi:hypothetical protein
VALKTIKVTLNGIAGGTQCSGNLTFALALHFHFKEEANLKRRFSEVGHGLKDAGWNGYQPKHFQTIVFLPAYLSTTGSFSSVTPCSIERFSVTFSDGHMASLKTKSYSSAGPLLSLPEKGIILFFTKSDAESTENGRGGSIFLGTLAPLSG